MLRGGGLEHALNLNTSHSYFLFTVKNLCFTPCEKENDSFACISCRHFSLVGVKSGSGGSSECLLIFIVQLSDIFIKYQLPKS